MSNIFFCFFTPSAVYSEKVQNVNNNKMFTFWNELHTTDKFKKNITFMFLFLDLLFVYMYICIS